MVNQTSESIGEFAPSELRETFRELLGPGVHLIAQQKLSGRRTFRVQAQVDGAVRSFIVKRLRPHIAQRNELLTKRWLPAVGLGEAVPALLGVAAERDGRRVWQIYEDLGDCSLVTKDAAKGAKGKGRSLASSGVFTTPEHIEAAVGLIAEVHVRFRGHPLLGECRLLGGDFGNAFFISSVRDAICGLEALLTREGHLSPERRGLVDRLLSDMRALLPQQARRAEVLEKYGGPETLLHGDFWPINVMVQQDGQAFRAWLIDWDHVGVGPVSYDVSNFLAHFPRHQRQWILSRYLEVMRRLGWYFSPDTEWNLLFDTAECSMLATEVYWAVSAILEDRTEWAFDNLAIVEQWIRMLEPILPLQSAGERL